MVRSQKKVRKKKSFGTRFFATPYVLPLMLPAVLVLQHYQRNTRRTGEVEKQARELTVRYQGEVERDDSLQKDSAIIDTREYVVKVAKEKLGLVDCGEVISRAEY